MAILELLNGSEPGKKFRLDSGPAVLGRHPDCDIVLDSGAVSRQHARITLVGGEYLVEDLQSRNGTFVNGEAILRPYALQDGDEVKICDLLFSFNAPRREALIGGTQVMDGSATNTLLLEDDRPGSQIMSKLDVTSSSDSLRFNVNPEIKLRALIEITQSLSKVLSLDAVLPKLIDSLFKIFFQADRGLIVLRNADGEPVPKVVRHRNPDAEDTIRLSRTILKQAMEGKQAILSADAASDQRFEMSQSIADFRIRSMMCAPLIDSEGNALGVIQVDTLDQRSRFQQDDLDVLVGVATQAAFAIDNAKLHERAMRQQWVQRDLELAHKVQRGLLPTQPPQLAGYSFFDFYEAASEVGGDFYDYIPLPEGRLAVVLADVSGKGVSAALVTAKLSAEVRYCLAISPTPADAINRINRSFCASGWDDRFVTLVLVVLDPARHRATVVNAGHMAPLLRIGEGDVQEVLEVDAGLPIGVYGDYEYVEGSIDLEPNQLMVLYTDGISEAMNPQSELYSIPRLTKQVGTCVTTVEQLGACILDDVQRFVSGHPQSDDMCLVCIGRVT